MSTQRQELANTAANFREGQARSELLAFDVWLAASRNAEPLEGDAKPRQAAADAKSQRWRDGESPDLDREIL